MSSAQGSVQRSAYGSVQVQRKVNAAEMVCSKLH